MIWALVGERRNAITRHDGCPLSGEQLDDRAADPGGGPGDDDDAAGELEVHVLSLTDRPAQAGACTLDTPG